MVAMAACSSADDDGIDYSQLTADLCDAYTDSTKKMTYAIIDDDTRLNFETPLSVSWASKADSVYRVLLYYNITSAAATAATSTASQLTVQPVSANYTLFLRPRTPEDAKEWSANQDAVTLSSIWMSKNKKYINMGLSVYYGNDAEGDSKHTFGLVCDSIAGTQPATDATTTNSASAAAAHRHYFYRLCHAQNGVPAYYTLDTYASIPISDISLADTISIDIPTTAGLIRKTLIKE